MNLETPDLFNDTNNVDAINIDKVFENIIFLYNKKFLSIVFNVLKLIMIPTNNKIKGWIKGWIKENLTC